MSEPVIEARDVRKTYPSGDRRIEVLRGVNLRVAPGESVAIRGESGSGKSTLLHLLAGLDAPESGEIRWAGGPATAARRAHYLGMVFQSFYLIPELDARQNVLMAARVRRALTAADRAPAQLSGGERQRVAVARALMNAPALILADEPTGNLDERTGEAVVDLLLDLCRGTGTALVLVTHNAAHAAKTQRQLFLRDGVLA